MTLAIFDLDHTLLSDDSDNMWGDFIVERGLVDGPSYSEKNERFHQDYKNGCLDARQYLSFVAEPLSRQKPEALAELHREFMLEKINPVILQKGRVLLEKHRQQGHLLMIITATNRFVTAPIAEALGVDVLIAAELAMEHGRYTGQPCGTPTLGEGKVIRLKEWLEEHDEDLTGAYFYSDSHNDIPLLKVVDNPVAVDPDDTLRQFAEENAMPLMSLRD
jgi:HAD superfamily hydrolase (TIGR01490 family)